MITELELIENFKRYKGKKITFCDWSKTRYFIPDKLIEISDYEYEIQGFVQYESNETGRGSYNLFLEDHEEYDPNDLWELLKKESHLPEFL